MKPWLGLALVAACTTPGNGAPPGVVPLRVIHLANGAVRFGAQVQIGDSDPFEAMVDTGSSGLRVLPGVVDDSAFAESTDVLVSASFHSGLALQGAMARGTVTLGELATPQPIPIMRVTTLGCTAAVPDCDAAGASIDNYQLFGNYRAILGIGLRLSATAAAIGSPIAQLDGAPAFAVRAVDYEAEAAELDLAPADTARFATQQLPALVAGAALENGVPAWDDCTVPACVTGAGSFCGGAMLDTGCPETKIEWVPYTGEVQTWPAGTEVSVSMGALGSYAFSVGATPTPGIDDVEVMPQTGTSLINLGTAIFFRDDVLFDPARGAIGLAPHQK